MDYLISLFEFNGTNIASMLMRFSILALTSAVIVYVIAVVILQLSKKETFKFGFRNWYKFCLMFGIIGAILSIGVIVIFTIRSNGLYYFEAAALNWDLYCGYILLLPEIALIAIGTTLFFTLRSSIYKSIK